MPGRRPVTVLASVLILVLATLSGCSPAGDRSAALDAFLAAVSKPDRSMQLQADGQVQLAGIQVEFNADYRVIGEDVFGSSAMRGGEIGLVQGLALVQGHTVTSFGDDGVWSIDDRSYVVPDPFNLVTREGVELVGTAKREDLDLVQLRVKEPAAAAGALATYGNPVLSTLLVNSFAYDLFVTADGAPVVADVALAGSISGELAGPVEAQLTLRFAAWGGIHELDLPFEIDSFPEGTTFVADNAFSEDVIWRDAVGFELLVPACSRRTSDAFDGTEFDVRFAADDSPMEHALPTSDGPYRYSRVAANGGATDQRLPIVRAGATVECTDRSG